MWRITCTDAGCTESAGATEIVDLLDNHRDPDGWFLCQCGPRGYIEKSFELQEPWSSMGAVPTGSDPARESR